MLPIVAVSLMLGGVVLRPPRIRSVKIGFSLPALDEYYSVVAENASNYAASKGYTLFQGNGVSGGDPTVQIAKVQNLLAQGINVLLISPQSEALSPCSTRRSRRVSRSSSSTSRSRAMTRPRDSSGRTTPRAVR